MGNTLSVTFQEGQFVKDLCNRQIGVIFATNIVVLLVTAAIFRAAERQNEIDDYNAAKVDYEQYMSAVMKLNITGVDTAAFDKVHQYAVDNIQPSDPENWEYWRAAYFTLTISSTIGYGNFAPQTQLGRGMVLLLIPTMIPPMAAMFGALGNAIANKSRAVLNKLTEAHCSHFQQAMAALISAWIMGTLMVLIISLLTWLCQHNPGNIGDGVDEMLSYVDCMYWCTITFTTIGLGDFTPNTRDFVGFLSFYVLVTIGLALIANIFSSMVDFTNAWMGTGDYADEGEAADPKAVDEGCADAGSKTEGQTAKVHPVREADAPPKKSAVSDVSTQQTAVQQNDCTTEVEELSPSAKSYT